MSSLIKYSNLVKEQNKVSNYPKLHYVSSSIKLEHVELEVLNKVLKNDVICTGVISTKFPIYKESSSLNYYEFLHPVDNNNVFTSWNYYYVGVNYISALKTKVPFVKEIDFKTGKKELLYLSRNTLLRKNLSRDTIQTEAFRNNNHPLLNHFLFTGRICIINNIFCYEYMDIQELHDSIEVKYLSLMPPLNFRSNIDITYKDSIHSPSVSAVPSKIYLKNEERLFEFTGEMNNTLLKNKVLYRYIETINNESYEVFLEAEPFYGNTDLILDSLGFDKTINIEAQGSSRIKTKQKSNINLKIDKT